MKKITGGFLISVLLLAMTGCTVSRVYDYNLDDYVKVGEYEGLPYTAFEVEVTDEEIQDEVEKVLQKYEKVKKGLMERLLEEDNDE